MPILLLGSSVFQLRRYADTATLPQSQDRTPRVRFRPLPGFYLFSCRLEVSARGRGYRPGQGLRRGIQLRFREMAKTIAAGPELACGSDSCLLFS